jgi:hypothetical protein
MRVALKVALDNRDNRAGGSAANEIFRTGSSGKRDAEDARRRE